ncbi:BTB/POZ domain-containing protein POB1 [Acorus gramineus]|uniref:BTB/POZ domain-containing protein POB1 n=1 Tax=Acorus gramineus TaxID=55184 RepID=A0AAV9B3L6_ACOGR|nr:BTB/POZ domain-containing protein POB1 [Acorus gramineus]
MDPNFFRSGSTFDFAFDDPLFSNRLIHLHITQTPSSIPTTKNHLLSLFSHLFSNPTNPNPDNNPPSRTRPIHVNSAILAAKSPFFHRLFSNGMLESSIPTSPVSLPIHSSEEPTLLDLLRYIYSGTLPFPTTRNPFALLNLLVAADKFEVTSCVSYCVTLLLRLPMTSDSALVYLDLPSSVSSTDESRPLVSAAEDYLVAHHKNFDKGADFQRLSVAGLETVLRRDDLRPDSEDEVFDAVLKWGRFNFPDCDERRRVLASCVPRLVRFPHMSPERLKDVLRCDDLDRDFATRVVQDALFFKAGAVFPRADDRRFVARDYKRKPMRMFKADRPCEHCVMYFDLKWEECVGLAPSGRIYSEAFRLGGHVFCLSAGRKGLDGKGGSFGLSLVMMEKGPGNDLVGFECGMRKLPHSRFMEWKYKERVSLSFDEVTGKICSPDLFSVRWESFVDPDNLYCIEGLIYLKAVVTVW